MKMILKYFMKPQYVLNTPIEKINPADSCQFLDISKVYIGESVEAILMGLDKGKVPERDVAQFKVKCLTFCVEFCSQILKRINFNDPVLKSLAILSPEKCKSDYIHSIMTLDIHFPNEEVMKSLICNGFLLKTVEALKKDDEFMDFWNKVFGMKNAVEDQVFPCLTVLVKAVLCLPHSSAATERIFSAVTLNKNKIRNKLQIPLVNGLLLTKEKLKHSSAADFTVSEELIKLASSARKK
ncbi:hypothetical protein PR048_018422 [Dryococelus australis]|uniref:HAT C-terminal dimerisation domain-containing protein n=1 Tax=Dryococelus australis TaxID=614101 RepID=A0ABQ9HCG8_9NEOP|nr:hypothetical protein PR048_018422 [Dryococelus australis]